MTSVSETSEPTDFLSYFGLGFLSLCFGSAFYFTHFALEFFSAAATGAFRIAIATAFLVPAALIWGPGLPKTKKLWAWSAAYGGTQVLIPFYLVTYVQTQLPTNVIGFYYASIPLLLLLLSRIFLGVRISSRKWLGFAVGFAGLVYLSGPGTYAQVGSSSAVVPQIVMLIVCIFAAGSGILIRVMPKVSPVSVTAAGALIISVGSLPIMITEWPTEVPPLSAVFGLLAVGLISTAIGLLMRFWLIRRRGPVFLAANPYLMSIVSGIIAVVLLHETIATETAVAFAIILTGLFIAGDGSGGMKRV